MTITVSLLLVVVGSILGIFESVQRSAVFSSARGESLDSMRVAMDRLTKELRQATSISAASTASRLEMDTFVNGGAVHVVYDATGSVLRRTVSGNATTVLAELGATSVFTYAPALPSVTLVDVTLTVTPSRRPGTTLKLTSEVRLRNGGTS